MEELSEIILGQLDDQILYKLRVLENWEAIKNITIELLKSLREICYDVNVRRVHPGVYRIHKMQDFLGCKQKKGQEASYYIAEVRSYYNVLKYTGGVDVFRTPLIEDTIKSKFPEFKNVEYDSLSDENKRKINGSQRRKNSCTGHLGREQEIMEKFADSLLCRSCRIIFQ